MGETKPTEPEVRLDLTGLTCPAPLLGAWTRATHVTLAGSREVGSGEWEFYLKRA